MVTISMVIKKDRKRRENKLRRKLAKKGYLLRKSRIRSLGGINFDNFGYYMIVDAKTNAIIAGSKYELTIDAIETFVKIYL